MTVRARLGQRAFRQRLLDTHGDDCAFTGPTPRAALDAAHLYSYAINGEHHDDGGLLLRRDLHRLFDLGLLAVNPEELTIDVSDQLAAYPLYADLHGKLLTVALSPGHRTWLESHWAVHRTELP
ncbi:HNH endonuclease [Kitasatospora sp. MBT63]|uniref:HNH endonuclease n=1 Tax=Kitasatospora sp. MBT63 TaxID=1444768 RepID=UPI00068EBF75|nr:HNH endonuclease [Kitasatospora sp. MBT63]